MMQVAVIQQAILPGHRSKTLQMVLRSVDAAAQRDPAPDLIVLPAFGDVLSFAIGAAAMAERTEGPTVAALSLEARQWGVQICLGLAERGPDRPYLTSLLLDYDGDVQLVHRQQHLPSAWTKRLSPGPSAGTQRIVAGSAALLTGPDAVEPAAWEPAVAAGAKLMLSSGCWPIGPVSEDAEAARAHVAGLAKQFGAWVVLADVMHDEADGNRSSMGLSAVISDTGELVACAEAGRPETIWADIELDAKTE